MGLGNPGPRYAETRHNIGFRIIERLADGAGIALKGRECDARTGRGILFGKAAVLALPQTFMNASGRAVGCLVARHRVSPPDLLVIFDDVSLPLGEVRLRARGSAGGHQGLADVMRSLGSEKIPRLRVGIGPGPRAEDLTPFVLGPFTRAEATGLEEGLRRSRAACEVWMREGIAPAMNRFNRRMSDV